MKGTITIFLTILMLVLLFNFSTIKPINANSSEIASINQMSPGDKISFAGITWIVLDPAKGYVFSEDSIITRAFDGNGKAEFDPNSNANIGYYMNEDFYNEFTSDEKSVVQWKTWNIGGSGNESSKTVDAHIGMLTESEWHTYKNLIGNPSQNFWTLTTSSGSYIVLVRSLDGTTSSAVDPTSPNPALHPTLYLNPDALFSRQTKKIMDLEIGNEFKFANTSWVVLDPQEGYILRKKSIANRNYDNNGNNQFNPSDSANIAYYLNVDFYNEFSPGEKDVILERDWTIENERGETESYSPVRAHIGLLSLNEWQNLREQISFLRNLPTTTNSDRTWLRTTRWYPDGFVFTVNHSKTPTSFKVDSNIKKVQPTLTLDPDYEVMTFYKMLPNNISFSENGNSQWAQMHTTKVIVSEFDQSELLKYAWSSDTNIPNDENDWTNFMNNSDINTPDNVTGKYFLHVRGKLNGDDFYGISKEFFIDNERPSSPTIHAITDWTKSQEITIEHGEDQDSGVDRTEYKIGDGNWESFSAGTTRLRQTITDSGEMDIQARTVDKAGNTSEIVTQTVKIDNIPPKLTVNMEQGNKGKYNSGDWANETISVEINVEDAHSGVSHFEVSINGSHPLIIQDNPFETTISGVGVNEFVVKATDLVGNETVETYTVKIDQKSPSEPTIHLNPSGWTNESVVTVTIDDGDDGEYGSGVAKTEYRIGSNQAWIEYVQPIEITDEGKTIIQARTVDNAGNTSEIAEKTVQIDRTPPEITLLGDHSFILELGTPFVDPGATAIDNVDGNISENIIVTGHVDNTTIGEYNIHYNVTDAAGNMAAEIIRTVEVVDTTPPEIDIKMTHGDDRATYTNDMWTKEGINFSIEAIDADMKELEIRINGTEITGINDFKHELNITDEGIYTIEYVAIDHSENISSGKRVLKIDQTSPEVTFAVDGNNSSKTLAVTTVSVTDLGSGVNSNSLKYIWTQDETPPLLDDDDWKSFVNETESIAKSGVNGEWYLHIYAEDYAGNSIIRTSSPFQLVKPTSSGGGSSGGVKPTHPDKFPLTDLQIFIENHSLFNFDQEIFEYDMEIDASEINMILMSSDNIIKVNGKTVQDRTTLHLNIGENIINIIVTSNNDMESEYIIRVIRPFVDIGDHWAKEFVMESLKNKWFKGYDNGEFKPENKLTRIQLASLFTRILELENGETLPFSDIVSVEKETIKELEKAYANGIIKGYPDQLFRPYQNITRAQFALMIARSYEKITGSSYQAKHPANFPDITGYDDETQNAIAMLVELGIAEGSNGDFMAGNSTTRAQAAKMLVNFKNVLDSRE